MKEEEEEVKEKAQEVEEEKVEEEDLSREGRKEAQVEK